jgi:hypothetical protein
MICDTDLAFENENTLLKPPFKIVSKFINGLLTYHQAFTNVNEQIYDDKLLNNST